MKRLPLLIIFLTLCNEMFAINTAPYGSWKSPISAEMLSSEALRFSDIKLIGQTLYWLESRPSDGGRTTLISYGRDHKEKELLPKQYNIRTRVHEYGGGALLVTPSMIFFVNDKDQQVYSLDSKGTAKQITNKKNARFADGSLSPSKKDLYYVMEEHDKTVINSIVKIDIDTGKIESVASGSDFYSNPRISPDGKSLAYTTWNHPNLPWDGTELYVVDVKTGKNRLVAGSQTESIMDAQWSSKNELYYVSDKTGWWNLYKEGNASSLDPVDAEFALPAWVFNRPMYGFASDGIIASYVENGSSGFVALTHNKKPLKLDLAYPCVRSISVSQNQVALIATSATDPNSIILYDLDSKKTTVIKRAIAHNLSSDWISKPQPISFATSDSDTAYAFYYPPQNPNYTGEENTLPPLLVQAHGGPTANVSPCFSLEIFYWTSRGFAVVNVNYRGSTGYGKTYRDKLKGTWGVYDVDDCVNAAKYLVDKQLVDPNRLAIEGGSAGGFTTLAALAFTDEFNVGADYFGVSDLTMLTLDTHKFESRYNDSLVGPYPEAKALYESRSPLHAADQITSPVIIFQGDEDAIVPPSQSELMYDSLKKRGIPTAYLVFKGEQHGFRKAENIRRAFEAELYFFSKILKFPLSDPIKPIEIDNLPQDAD